MKDDDKRKKTTGQKKPNSGKAKPAKAKSGSKKKVTAGTPKKKLTTAKKQTSANKKPRKKVEREPNYPKDFLRELDEKGKANDRLRKMAEAANSDTSKKTKRADNISIPKGAKVTKVCVHYKFD
jgi:hypothetical protein